MPPNHLYMPSKKKTSSNGKDSYRVSGEKVVSKVKQLIKEGNARRIIIKDEKGKVLIELPLTVGVIGAALAPMLAAVGALAALITDCTIEVERK